MSTMRDGRGLNMDGATEEDDWIEAEIQRELDALSPLDDSALSSGTQDEDDIVNVVEDGEEPPPNGTIPESVTQFLERVKNRAQDAQTALEECDKLLDSSHRVTDEDDVENFAYKSKELNELAFQLGEDPEELRDRVIHELDEADKKDLEDYEGQRSEGQVNGLDLVPVLDEESGAVMVYTDVNKFEQDLMEKVQALEGVLQEREEIETREREEAGRTMAILDQNAERLRQKKQQENDEEQRRLAQERMVTQARMEEEIGNETRQTEEELQQYQHQIDELSRQTAQERAAFEQEQHHEVQRQHTKKHTAATTIQAAFRSYRVRKPYKKKMRLIQEGLKEKRENERQMEIVLSRKRKEEQKRKEKLEKMKKEEEERKRREEEEKRKEEERLEIERLERIKLKKEKKEKERLEKERQKREEEEAKKQEELKKQSEEILKRILPDHQPKAIEGRPDAGDTNLQDAPRPDAKDTEGTPNASAKQQGSSSTDRTNESSINDAIVKEEQSVSQRESVFITEKSTSFVGEPSSKDTQNLMGNEDKGQERTDEVLDHSVHERQLGKMSQSHMEASQKNLDGQLGKKAEGELHHQAVQQSSISDGYSGGGKSNNRGGSTNVNHETTDTTELSVSGKVMQSTPKSKEDLSRTMSRNPKVSEDIASASLLDTATDQQTGVPKNAGIDILPSQSQEDTSDSLKSGNINVIEQGKTEKGMDHSVIERQKEGRSAEGAGKGDCSGEMSSVMEHRPLVGDLDQRRLQWIQDCTSLTKLASRAKLASTSTKPRRQLRRPASAKKIQALSEDQIKAVSPSHVPLDQVTTVQLKDLPGSSLTSLTKCQRLRTLTLNNCGVPALESLDESPDILWIDVSHNKIESMLCRDRRVLCGLDASWNILTSLQGIEGCSQLRKLNLSHNKITRISGVETLLSLTHLDLSHNQLVNVSGLTSLVHLQNLNLTSNHLSSVRGLDHCPLLQRLDLSSNSLSQIPNLSNNVLLRSLSLAGNSLSSLGDFTSVWLPLLLHLDLSQNGLSELTLLKSFLLLNHFNVSHNFISDVECLIAGLEGCTQLKHLDVQGNALTEEPHYRDDISKVLPGLQQLDSDLLTSGTKVHDLAVTPSSFEVMCRSQVDAQDALNKRQDGELSTLTDQGDLKFGVVRAEMLSRHLEETFQQAVEHRYAHEYGETTPATSINSDDVALTSSTQKGISSRQRVSSDTGVSSAKESTRTVSSEALKVGSPGLVSTSSVGVSPAKGGSGATPSSAIAANQRQPTSQVTGLDGSIRSLATEAGRDGRKVKEMSFQGTRSKQEHYGSGSHEVQRSSDTSTRVDAKAVSKALQKDLETDRTSPSDDAATLIQACWRGYSVRRSIDIGTKQWLAALRIQAYWRGHKVRRWMLEVKRSLKNDTGAHVDEDEAEYAEIDLGSFEFDEDMMDKGLTTPSETPTLLSKYPPLPPTSNSSHTRPNPRPTQPSSPSPHKPYPPSTTKPSSPEKPQTRPYRQAWRGADSPLHHLEGSPQGGNLSGGVSSPEGMGGGLVMKKPPLPPTTPSSMSGTEVLSMGTPRTQRTARQEQLTEEWGFKDSVTADLMMKRAKKLAKGKKKKLDPIQRYQQIRKNQDSSTARPPQITGKKGVQRKDYFQAREEEAERRVKSKVEENSNKKHRTFDWVHAQVNNDLPVSESRINPYGIRSRQSNSEPNLPAISPDVIQGSRVNLVMSPNAMEVQSVDSVSLGDFTSRERSRSFSSPNGEKVQFPPIKTSSAPSSHTKQRIATQGGDRRGGGGVAWGSAGSNKTGRGKISR